MDFLIRAATPADTEQILALFPRLAAFEIPPQRRPEFLWQGDAEQVKRWSEGALPELLVFVAVNAANEVLGVSVARMGKELLSHAPSAHLEALMVRKEAEGRGIGGQLVDAIEQEARARGATSMTLHVFGSNTRARELYRRKGFNEELIRAIKFFDE
jgi:ribosomal protein S18 acetylase RimI-like enzyme